MGMDRPISRKKNRGRVAIGVLAAAAAAFFAYRAIASGAGRPGAVPPASASDLKIASVEEGEFRDYVQVNAYVEAARRVFIDAREGGVVKAVHADRGRVVAAGSLLVELESPELEAELALKEAALASQSAKASADAARIERHEVDSRRELLEADYRIAVLERDCERKAALVEAGGSSRSALEDARAELAFRKDSRGLLERSRELEAEGLRGEAALSREAAEMLRIERDRLAGRRASLRISAPALGQIASFSASIGETKAPGSRVAELDIMDDLRLKADLDEYYLSRVKTGLRGSFSVDDGRGGEERRGMAVSWVSPKVANSSFEVEFACDPGQGVLAIGQRFAARVELGGSSRALLLPMGPFYRDTGGSWVYAAEASGTAAARRAIKAGRSNPDYLEILEGLAPGDRVVISDYSAYGNAERISLKGGSGL